jgi:hypothetical protein
MSSSTRPRNKETNFKEQLPAPVLTPAMEAGIADHVWTIERIDRIAGLKITTLLKRSSKLQ